MKTVNLLVRGVLGSLLLVVSALATAGNSGCTLDDWSSTSGTPLAGPPDSNPTAFPRYSGRCAIQTDAIGDQVIDDSPSSESTYFVRFYYYTGDRSGGSADIFQARRLGSAISLPIRVRHDGAKFYFNTNGSGMTRDVAVESNRWYSIELGWGAATAIGQTNGFLQIAVTGAGNDAPLMTPAMTSVNNATDRIDQARMGLITGSGSGPVVFDAFDSLRDGPPGRLCRGDANGDSAIGAQDRIMITNEIASFGEPISPGQPDANEDGAVGAQDRITVTNMISSFYQCPTSGP